MCQLMLFLVHCLICVPWTCSCFFFFSNSVLSNIKNQRQRFDVEEWNRIITFAHESWCKPSFLYLAHFSPLSCRCVLPSSLCLFVMTVLFMFITWAHAHGSPRSAASARAGRRARAQTSLNCFYLRLNSKIITSPAPTLISRSGMLVSRSL